MQAASSLRGNYKPGSASLSVQDSKPYMLTKGYAVIGVGAHIKRYAKLATRLLIHDKRNKHLTNATSTDWKATER
jgi:hypothetical protein